MKPTQQTIDKFRKTILNNTSEEHKAEILELKKGCRVFVQNYVISVEILIDKTDWARTSTEDFPLDFVGFTGSEDLANFDKKHIKEIIGRDLTLEDVLLALWRKKLTIYSSVIPGFVRITDDIFWNLTLPSHLQEEETLLAIIKLFE